MTKFRYNGKDKGFAKKMGFADGGSSDMTGGSWYQEHPGQYAADFAPKSIDIGAGLAMRDPTDRTPEELEKMRRLAAAKKGVMDPEDMQVTPND